jgi:hypothetical protein
MENINKPAPVGRVWISPEPGRRVRHYLRLRGLATLLEIYQSQRATTTDASSGRRFLGFAGDIPEEELEETLRTFFRSSSPAGAVIKMHL